MREAEERGLPYLFKLKKTAKVSRHIVKQLGRQDWSEAGAGWQGIRSELQLTGWSRARRVVILRRLVRKARDGESAHSGSAVLPGLQEFWRGEDLYEYAVLVTSLEEEVLGIAQLYRDRAEAENIFDELKNQWGWTGFTTHDVQRSQVMARMVGLIYNWWSLYTRLAIPHRHTEAITSRPLLLHGIGRKTTHSNQSRLTVTSSHAHIGRVQYALEAVSRLLRKLRDNAEQLANPARWSLLLRFIFRDWLKNSGPNQPDLAPLLG